MKTIGLCSANVERSRTFQAVIGNEVEQQRLDDKIWVYSAGLNVEKILKNESPLRIQINILQGGLKYGVVRNEIRGEVERIVEAGYEQCHTDRIKALYGEVRPLVHGINFTFTNHALGEVGINQILPPYTKLNPKLGYDLVLPMDSKDIEKATERFSDIEIPVIMSYGQLVGAPELADKDMASGLKGAREKVAYFMDTRRIAVQKMLQYVK